MCVLRLYQYLLQYESFFPVHFIVVLWFHLPSVTTIKFISFYFLILNVVLSLLRPIYNGGRWSGFLWPDLLSVGWSLK